VTEADGRLGLCDILPGGPSGNSTWAGLVAAAGARVNRWEFRWDRVQPKPGVWNFAADDPAVDASLAAGIAVEGILIGTPAWATAAGQKPGNGLPRGLGLSAADPGNLWASYVRGVVLHYRGEVRTWEIWNEPDLGFFWSGSADDYFSLMSVAYDVIKGVDPSATVVMAGMVVPDLAFLTRVVVDAQNVVRGGGDAPFDAAAWHAYGQASLLYTNLLRIRQMLSAHGFTGTPVWVTEDGFPASNPNGEPRQAAYVLQTILYALSAGAEKILIYRASDDTGPKTWGLLTPGGQPRMGYVALQVAARYLAHAQAVTYEPGGSVERFAIYEPGRRVTVLWTKSLISQSVSLPAGPGTGTLVDWQGASSSLAASNGEFALTLPGANYNSGIDPTSSVVGGQPVLLLEANAPQAGGPIPSFLPALPGSHRRLVLLNSGGTDADVQVTAASAVKEHALYRIPAGSLEAIDLDLVAGPHYSGGYAVSAPTGVTYAGASDSTLATASSPALTWYGASASGNLLLSNPSSAEARMRVDLYTPKGALSARVTLAVAPHSQLQWAVPPANTQLSAVVRSTQPVVVAATPAFTTHPTSSWYVVRPAAGLLHLYNPAPTQTPVDVRFVGGGALTGQQLRLAGRHSYGLSTHGAKAVVIDSPSPIVVASPPQAGLPAALQSASEAATVTDAGPATRVALFNPTAKPAHISYTLVSRSGMVQHVLDVAPSHVSTVVARQTTDPARGVLLRSDTPVVAVASR
jgi:hypothetical protein